MGPQPVFFWDDDEDFLEAYLHCRVPSLAQLAEEELKLKLQSSEGTDYVCL